MAKIHLQRLIKQYDFSPDEVSGSNYRKLIKRILQNNAENMSKASARLSSDHWSKSLNKLSRSARDKRQFILPNVEEVMPKRSIFINKAAERGELITDTLRDRLTKDLRDTLNGFRTESGEPAFLRRAGAKAGTINPKLIDQLQKNLQKTFQGYTKRDPRYGVPGNIKTIATTEARSAINGMKRAYNEELMRRNPNIRMKKTWLQNRSLAKEPRKGHGEVNGQTIDFRENFNVPNYQKVKGIWMLMGHDLMDGPHDPNAPAEQVIGCNCDIKYFAEILDNE